MKLEVGKRYLDSNGTVVEVLKVDGKDKLYPVVGYDESRDKPDMYMADGRFDADEESGYDLVALAPQEYVRWAIYNGKGEYLHSETTQETAESEMEALGNEGYYIVKLTGTK